MKEKVHVFVRQLIIYYLKLAFYHYLLSKKDIFITNHELKEREWRPH
jgi:hypothetical protein